MRPLLDQWPSLAPEDPQGIASGMSAPEYCSRCRRSPSSSARRGIADRLHVGPTVRKRAVHAHVTTAPILLDDHPFRSGTPAAFVPIGRSVPPRRTQPLEHASRDEARSVDRGGSTCGTPGTSHIPHLRPHSTECASRGHRHGAVRWGGSGHASTPHGSRMGLCRALRTAHACAATLASACRRPTVECRNAETQELLVQVAREHDPPASRRFHPDRHAPPDHR